MNPIRIMWGIAALLAVIALVRLMRSKQARLTAVLHTYVEQQMRWTQKRDRTTKIVNNNTQTNTQKSP